MNLFSHMKMTIKNISLFLHLILYIYDQKVIFFYFYFSHYLNMTQRAQIKIKKKLRKDVEERRIYSLVFFRCKEKDKICPLKFVLNVI